MTVVSIRFSSSSVHERLKRAATSSGTSASGLAERLIDEGLRMEAHPMVVFRSGPAGRRAAIAGGPDVAYVIGAMLGGDVPPTDRRERAGELLGLTPAQIDAALAYYADFTADIDAELTARAEATKREEASWRRQRELLARSTRHAAPDGGRSSDIPVDHDMY